MGTSLSLSLSLRVQYMNYFTMTWLTSVILYADSVSCCVLAFHIALHCCNVVVLINPTLWRVPVASAFCSFTYYIVAGLYIHVRVSSARVTPIRTYILLVCC